MQLAIEKWLDSQKLSLEANSCFKESFTCYRIGANKAALLFSYLGFMNVIRGRIISAVRPAGIPGSLWEDVHKKIKSPEVWDKITFEAIQRKKPTPIFVIPDDLRHQVEFWKNRRNDTAHSKDNKITSAYVETFYAFIESNLNKFAVNGSRAQMLRHIQEFYDPSLTPPDSDIKPVIKEISNAVFPAELPSFLLDASRNFDEIRDPIEIMLNKVSDQKLHFLNAIFLYGSPELTSACNELLRSDEELLIAFLRAYPEKTVILEGYPELLRKLWHNYLFITSANDFPIIASLFRNRLIPSKQIGECLRHIISKGISDVPNDLDNATLEENGFYRQLEDILINTRKFSNFEWANKSKSIVVKHIAEHPISVELARIIYDTFYSEFHPWHMASHLDKLFSTNSEKLNEYISIADSHEDIGWPSHIPSLRVNQ